MAQIIASILVGVFLQRIAGTLADWAGRLFHFLFDRFAIRLGYRIDMGQKTHSLSGGLGWVDKHFSVEASVRQDVIADHPNTMIVLGLRYFYDYGSAGQDPAMTAD